MPRRRTATFIHGAGDDARDITDHLAGYLDALNVGADAAYVPA